MPADENIYCPLLTMNSKIQELCMEGNCAFYLHPGSGMHFPHCAIAWIGIQAMAQTLGENGRSLEKENGMKRWG